jgi:hypothetical protein
VKNKQDSVDQEFLWIIVPDLSSITRNAQADANGRDISANQEAGRASSLLIPGDAETWQVTRRTSKHRKDS